MVLFLAWIGVGSAALIALSAAPAAITVRSGLLLCVTAFLALATGPGVALGLSAMVVATTIVDIWLGRDRPAIARNIDRVLARGVATTLKLDVNSSSGARVRLRQPLVPDVTIEPAEADDALIASVVATRRGVHHLPAPAVRITGPLGLGAWYRRADDVAPATLRVYPDLPAARRIAQSVRTGRFPNAGIQMRGPLGLGTEFELVREYAHNDDVRQVNWRATQRMGRPMSNQYRIEQDRDVMVVIDCGRLMASPVRGPDGMTVLTRLDAALDAAAAIAYVADEVGDRCGVIAFDDEVRLVVKPTRRGGERVVEATFDLQPTLRDADYEAAFRRISSGKRSFVAVFTDLLDEAAASALIDAVPVLGRRHIVVVCSVSDPDLEQIITTPPLDVEDVYRATVALDVIDARTRTTALLTRAGARVIESPPATLADTCVRSYLRAKAAARL